MALVTLKQILSESVQRRYAVGAFDMMGPLPLYAEAILEAAEKRNVPVILMTLEWELENESYFTYLIDRCIRSPIPVALHLDHGSSFSSVMKAIHLGFTSVMLDASAKPLAENIEMTRKVVEAAHACGVSVEAEIGHVGGLEGGDNLSGNVADESGFTTPEMAEYFCREAGPDALAVAFGTVHGVYKGTPHLDLDRLSAIRRAVDVPLVMHGGSGLTADMFRDAVRCGINKVNFFTGMTLAASASARALLEEKDGKVGFEAVCRTAQDTMRSVVEEHIGIFGTQPLTVG
ncbi:MAG: ketose-bisphosphate aldolase [Oscillospiraceae bacterium]